jgi:hypothetical protein
MSRRVHAALFSLLLGCSPGRAGIVPGADAAADAAPDASADAAPDAAPAVPPATTFGEASDQALQTLVNVFYDDGNWRLCVPKACGLLAVSGFDWGADSLTAALWLRWSYGHDASIVPLMHALDTGGASYGTCTATSCPSWSDVPLWDSVAGSHEYVVTKAASALARAKGAFAYVDTATEFAKGACPTIDFQIPVAGGDGLEPQVGLKTLETDSNYIKAALLLHQLTGEASYLDKATAKYAAVRKYFLDPSVPLYTVYVIDDGTSCTPVLGRYYASVNGNMIWNGVALAAATGTASYQDDAVATAKAVAADLSDPDGVFADLQTDDDVVEPLVEAMAALAARPGQTFAATWITTNARAMAGARTASGVYGRFFDGPPPPDQITEWQANGGLALAFAAGGLSPSGNATGNAAAWQGATSVTNDQSMLPFSIEFTGRAIAVFGTLGVTDYMLGQASVWVDGTETFDKTGIHQNESNAFGPVPDSILFAWRWPASGAHTLRFEGQPTDPKDGSSFLHITSYAYVP